MWHDIAYFNDPNTPVATQYTYDANGNLTTVTAPANSGTDTTYRTTTFSYDALNRLTYAFDPVNTTVHPTQYGFDGLDQVRSVTDPRNLVTSYTVNGLGDATQEASPDSRTTNRTFDEAGNLKSSHRCERSSGQLPIRCLEPAGLGHLSLNGGKHRLHLGFRNRLHVWHRAPMPDDGGE